MSNHADDAVVKFEKGFNCSQAVFATFPSQYNLPEELALRIAAPFGGGMSRMGEVCGAVTGALMAIGLHLGNMDAQDQAGKEETYQYAQQFIEHFKQKHRTILCRELLGLNINNPANYLKARETGLFHTVCPLIVHESAEILGRVLG